VAVLFAAVAVLGLAMCGGTKKRSASSPTYQPATKAPAQIVR
jgi:hypothetical protein